MRPQLRTIAFLMLLAGLSLGVFTTRALRAVGDEGGAANLPAGPREPRIEMYLDLLQDLHQLDPDRRSRVGEVLRGYDRAVRQKVYDLRLAHQAEFRALFDEAQTSIDGILAEAAPEK